MYKEVHVYVTNIQVQFFFIISISLIVTVNCWLLSSFISRGSLLTVNLENTPTKL